MADIFGYTRNPKPAGVLSSENSTLVIGGAASASLATLVQDWTIQYQQNVEEIYELGSNRVFWKKGRPTGGGSIGRLVGAGVGSGIKMFGKEAVDVCDGGATMQFTVGGGSCQGESPFTITLSGVVVTSVGYQSRAADPQVVEALQWRCTGMSI